jgi:hypothetical protein
VALITAGAPKNRRKNALGKSCSKEIRESEARLDLLNISEKHALQEILLLEEILE